MTTFPSQSGSPADNVAAITPSDGTDLAEPTRGLYVGVGGNVSVDLVGTGTAVVFVGVPSGSILPIRVKRVRSTSTSATNILGLW